VVSIVRKVGIGGAIEALPVKPRSIVEGFYSQVGK
jgi:hypothetical protein